MICVLWVLVEEMVLSLFALCISFQQALGVGHAWFFGLCPEFKFKMS
jgi:hypothetical protein